MKRFLRVLKLLTLGVLALVAAACIVVALVNWRDSARLQQKIADLRAAGQPVSLADLARKPIPPEANAATYLRRARDAVDAIQKEVWAADDADQDSIESGRLTPNMEKILRAAFESYPNTVGLIVQAAGCPDYDLQLDYNVDTNAFLEESLDTPIQVSRGATRVLNYRAALWLADKEPDKAMQTCLVMLKLTRLFDREPLIVNYLVALACRGYAIRSGNLALRAGPISQATRDALEQELARQDLVASFRQTLRSERAFGLQCVGELTRQLWSWPLRVKLDQCAYADAMDAAIDAAGRPYSDSAARGEVDKALQEGGPVIALLYPALEAAQIATYRVEAQLRCLRVLDALVRYEQAVKGEEPKLTDLGLPADVIIDPYNGQPLKLKKLPAGWVIYSVGQKLHDGGGEHLGGLPDEDVGLGPPQVQPAGNNGGDG